MAVAQQAAVLKPAPPQGFQDLARTLGSYGEHFHATGKDITNLGNLKDKALAMKKMTAAPPDKPASKNVEKIKLHQNNAVVPPAEVAVPMAQAAGIVIAAPGPPEALGQPIPHVQELAPLV